MVSFTSKGILLWSAYFSIGSWCSHISSPAVKNEISDLSIPDLPKLKNIQAIKDTWVAKGSAKFFEGRVILTPKPTISSNIERQITVGSLWSKSYKNAPSLSEIEFQLTLRSLGKVGDTGAGISFFVVNDDEKQSSAYDYNGYGGPSRYTGLQITFDTNDRKLGSVIKVFMNDGTKNIQLQNDYIGAYKYEYQNSNVPVTVKVGYFKDWLKITADNKLLFESNQINLDSLIKSQALHIGVTAASRKDVGSYEQFELLRLKAYNKVTAELKADCRQNLLATHNGNVVKLERKVESQEKHKENARISDSDKSVSDLYSKLSDIQNYLVDRQIVQDGSASSEISASVLSDARQIKALLNKMIDSTNNVFRHVEQSNKRFDELEARYDKLQQLMQQHSRILENVESISRNQEKNIKQHVEQFSQTMDNKVQGMQHEYLSRVSMPNPELEAKLNKLASVVKFVLLPVAILCCIILLLVNRIRHDIKHAKVL